MYWLKVYQLPLASRNARGRPIVNILPLEDGERITAILQFKPLKKVNMCLWQRQTARLKRQS